MFVSQEALTPKTTLRSGESEAWFCSFLFLFLCILICIVCILLRAANGEINDDDSNSNKRLRMIVNNRKNTLIKANSSNVGQLWALLRKSENWGSKSKKIDCCGNVNDINEYFTSVVYRVAVPTSG